MRSYRVGIVAPPVWWGSVHFSFCRDIPGFTSPHWPPPLAARASLTGKQWGDRWAFDWEIPAEVADMTVFDAQNVEEVAKHVDFIFLRCGHEKG